MDSLGRTCLHVAASGGYGYYVVVSCIFYCTIWNSSFVFHFFTDRNVECLKLLLNSGADLSKKDNFGRYKLYLSIIINLLDTGAHITFFGLVLLLGTRTSRGTLILKAVVSVSLSSFLSNMVDDDDDDVVYYYYY